MSVEHVTIPAALAAQIVADMQAARERYAEIQASRFVDRREGEFTRAELDDVLIEARMRWDRDNTGLAAFRRLVRPDGSLRRGVQS